MIGLRLAIGTLTIIPVGDIHPLPRGAGRTAMLLAPLAVVPIAAAAGLVMWLALAVGVPAFVAAALVLALMAILTRAMHLDGLADTIDGMGGGWTRERALEIMHRGDVGPMGVAGIVLVLLIQTGSLASLAVLPWSGLLAAASICASRVAATVLCTTPIPSARESGMGAVVARSVPIAAALASAAAVAAVLSAAVSVTGLAWWWGLIAFGVMLAVLGIFTIVSIRKFGGITGDVLGAGIEIAFTTLLVVLSVGVTS